MNAPHAHGAPPNDTVELGELLRAFLRGFPWFPAGILFGVVVAAGVNLLPPSYEAESSVLLKDGGGSSANPLSALTEGGIASGMADALSLPGALSSGSSTEAAILGGSGLLSEVVTEAGLQVRVTRPGDVPERELFSAIDVDEDAPRARYRFRAAGDGYRIRGPSGFRADVAAGGTAELPGARLTLRSGALPDGFTVEVLSLWETLYRIGRRNQVEVENEDGDVALVTVRWRDPATASMVANRLVEVYLEDRIDRMGRLNREKLRLLEGVRDSLAAELEASAAALWAHHEETGTFDPERLGDLERIAQLRGEVDALEVEARALDRVLERMDEGEVTTSDLLAFPSFLASAAINDILRRLFDLRASREQLLERRTEQDADVRALDRSIAAVEAELGELARSYRAGIDRNLDEITRRLATYRADLSGRGMAEVEAEMREAEVERMTSLYLAVQTQVVRTRLDGLDDGAELRQVDRALVPVRPGFPRPRLNLVLGLLAGGLLGMVTAVGAGTLSSRVRDPDQVERRLGLPVLDSAGGAPLPAGVRNGGARLVGIPGEATGRAALSALERGWGVPPAGVQLLALSEVSEGDRVLIALSHKDRSLDRAARALAGIRAAGGIPLGIVLLPPGKNGAA